MNYGYPYGDMFNIYRTHQKKEKPNLGFKEEIPENKKPEGLVEKCQT